jgi:large subunit ribosomal protein L16
MLAPKRLKYRKQFRGMWRNIAVKGDTLAFGSFGLKATERGWMKDREIEATRIIFARATKKSGKYWNRVFPDKPYTKKPPEVTMGAGKGDLDHYVVSVAPGRILFELDGLTEVEARAVCKQVASKLSIQTKIITRSN